MCGIAGIITLDGSAVSRHELDNMTDVLAHRGPDGRGTHVQENVGLGHRRLSIVDLAGGSQPMTSDNNDISITYNGEIYNHVELRQELEREGHRFHTRCDTEVVLRGYETWGQACVHRFRGMFAFAIHDSTTRQLFLARDRLGIKPLYYSVDPRRIAFASELQALYLLPGTNLTVDFEALADYLTFKYIPAPKTIYKNIKKLPAGNTLVIDDTGCKQPRKYWDLDFSLTKPSTETEWLEKVEHTIGESVRLRLRADVSFGAFLSGGIDSSIVTAVMTRQLTSPVRTYSIGFESEEFSELGYANQAALHCNTAHHTEVVNSKAMALLPTLVRHLGEPLGDTSTVPMHYVSRLARRDVKMVLSGDGGDESFAGYDRYSIAFKLAQRHGRLTTLKQAIGNVGRRFGILPARMSPGQFWCQLSCLMNRHTLYDLAGGNTWGVSSEIHESLIYDQPTGVSDLCSWLQFLDLKFYLPSILTKVDTMSMLHGLEVRVPLLDHELVELAASMPLDMKLRQDSSGHLTNKYLLRQHANSLYWPELFERKKRGFSAPIHHWHDESEKWRELLVDPSARLVDIFDKKRLENYVSDLTQDYSRARKLWTLVVLAEWFRQHPRATLA